MPSPIFDHTILSYVPETFPTTIADNDPIPCSLIPHYHVKHPYQVADIGVLLR